MVGLALAVGRGWRGGDWKAEVRAARGPAAGPHPRVVQAAADWLGSLPPGTENPFVKDIEAGRSRSLPNAGFWFRDVRGWSGEGRTHPGDWLNPPPQSGRTSLTVSLWWFLLPAAAANGVTLWSRRRAAGRPPPV